MKDQKSKNKNKDKNNKIVFDILLAKTLYRTFIPSNDYLINDYPTLKKIKQKITFDVNS